MRQTKSIAIGLNVLFASLPFAEVAFVGGFLFETGMEGGELFGEVVLCGVGEFDVGEAVAVAT